MSKSVSQWLLRICSCPKKKKHQITHTQKQHLLEPLEVEEFSSNLATTWKALNDQAPKYIEQLLHRKPQQKHNLRSNSKLQLNEPVSQNKNNFEDRAFSFVAPKLWNRLDESVRNAITLDSFKKKLKTHLFQKFYKSQ